MRFAGIDIGSNSVLLHIGERNPDGTYRAILDRSQLTRLGDGLHRNGSLSFEGMEKTVEALTIYKQLAESHLVSDIAVVGTMALRTAKNASAFVQRVAREIDIKIEVISGKEEARLAYLGVCSGLFVGSNTVAIFDVGGGSTEFIFGSGRAIDSSCSFNIGALGLTETYIRTDPVAVADFDSLLRELEVSLGKLTSHRFDLLIGIGGAITNMAAIKHQLTVYDSSLVHGSVLDLAEVERQIELFLSMNLAERRRLTGLEPGRADTILAGAGIVLSVMKTLDTDRVTVSDRGLRQGLVLDRFGCE